MISSKLRHQYPDEPWKWDKQWSTGVLRSGGPGGVIGYWLFTLIWCGMGTAICLAYFGVLHSRSDIPVMFPVLFGSVGVMIFLSAILQTLRYVRFGRSELALTPFPAHPGEPLNASIRVHASLAGAQDVTAKLQCVRRERRGTGQNSSTFDNVIWEDTQHAPLADDLSDTLIRATFNPEFNALETSRADLNNVIEWRLTVRGIRQGLDYSAAFELPMFKRSAGDASPQARPFPRSAVAPSAEGLPTDELAAQRIHVRLLAGRSFAVDFPAGRRLGLSLTFFVIGLIFVGIALGFALPQGFYGPYDFHFAGKSAVDTVFNIGHELVRSVFVFGFGLFGLIFTLAGGAMIITGTTATADRTGLAVVRNVLGFHFRRTVDAKDITSIDSYKTSSSGDHVYYSIRATTADGKTFMFGSGIEDRHISDRLAAAMLVTLGKAAAK